MKNMEKVFFGTMAVAFVAGMILLIVAAQPVEPPAAVNPPPALSESEAALARNATQRPAQPGTPPAPAHAPTPVIPRRNDEPAPKRLEGGAVSPQVPTAPGQSGPRVKPPAQDPLARMALAYVGLDSEAETYWLQAINDPGLPAVERQDLIEDLNEDGLSDPKHPTAADLPLILARLLLIESLAPEAMDKVNADAFQEAYKDLVNLANVALGGGEPVR